MHVREAGWQLGVQALSHSLADVSLHRPQLHLLLGTTTPAHLHVEVLVHGEMAPNEGAAEARCGAVGAEVEQPLWARPRLHVDRDASGRNHSVMLHLNARTGRFTVRLFALPAAERSSGTASDDAAGWPLVLEYTVTVDTSAGEAAAAAAGVLEQATASLGGLAASALSSLGGLMSDNDVTKTPAGLGNWQTSGFMLPQIPAQSEHWRSVRTDVGAVDAYARALPESAAQSGVLGLGRALCVWHGMERNYRAIFVWVATHVRYDEVLLRQLEQSPRGGHGVAPTASGVLRERKAVCGGFAELVAALCTACGIPAVVVSGHARSSKWRVGMVSEPLLGHAWVALSLDADTIGAMTTAETRWALSDPTWAVSSVDDESTTTHAQQPAGGVLDTAAADDDELDGAGRTEQVRRGGEAEEPSLLDEYYYLPSAAELLATHLPREHSWCVLTSFRWLICRACRPRSCVLIDCCNPSIHTCWGMGGVFLRSGVRRLTDRHPASLPQAASVHGGELQCC